MSAAERPKKEGAEESPARRAIITVVGRDRVGIIAGISAFLAESNVNILDISQTILQEYFTMMMIVDLAGSKMDTDELREKLVASGESLGLSITLQLEQVFKAMHRIDAL
ncbi:MAG: ACT domain-containing protein [Spirochaetales bacterium]|nr:ACT domain-containing protein [Spirochaetales bacterium]